MLSVVLFQFSVFVFNVKAFCHFYIARSINSFIRPLQLRKFNSLQVQGFNLQLLLDTCLTSVVFCLGENHFLVEFNLILRAIIMVSLHPGFQVANCMASWHLISLTSTIA